MSVYDLKNNQLQKSWTLIQFKILSLVAFNLVACANTWSWIDKIYEGCTKRPQFIFTTFRRNAQDFSRI